MCRPVSNELEVKFRKMSNYKSSNRADKIGLGGMGVEKTTKRRTSFMYVPLVKTSDDSKVIKSNLDGRQIFKTSIQ